MDRDVALRAFDEHLRRRTGPSQPGTAVEHDDRGGVIRVVAGAGWTGVVACRLDAAMADAVIAAQVARFASMGREWEWKHYAYDTPPDLPDRLRAAGFVAQDTETLMVAEIAELELDVVTPGEVEVRPVTDETGIADLVAVHHEVFGGVHDDVGRALMAGLAVTPSSVAAVVAYAGDRPVASGRLELHRGSAFASLWGGGTVVDWRGRGLFRALVAHRAVLAAAAGFRYLQVDATDDSRPILERLGFVAVTATTPFIHRN